MVHMGNVHTQKWIWISRAAIVLILFLSACQPAAPVEEQTSEVTQPPVEVTRQAAATNTPAAASTESSGHCSTAGEVKRYKLDSDLMNEALYVSVYLPPCYDASRAEPYPVLYLLHGQTFDDDMWLDLGAGDIADELILDGAAQPFLMVMSYEEFYYRKPDTTMFEPAFLNEVIPFVEGQFNACTQRTCRALGGISRGASWALRLGLIRWDVFASFGAHSLPTFRGDLSDIPDWLDEIPDDSFPRIYLDTGRFDPEVKTTTAVEQLFNEKGILHEWHLNDGRHNEDYWAAHMREYIQWYAAGWDDLQ